LSHLITPNGGPGRPDEAPAGLPRSYRRQVCQRALLGGPAAAGFDAAARQGIADRAVALRRRWHGRVLGLAEADVAPFCDERKRWAFLRCLPACYVPQSRLRACGLRAICPDCWARQALACFDAIDARLFTAPGLLAADVLVERTVSYRFPLEVKGQRTLPAIFRCRLDPAGKAPRSQGKTRFLTRTQEIRRLSRLGTTGGLDVLRVELGGRAGRPSWWRVLIHQVLLVPAAVAPALLAHPAVAAAPVLCTAPGRVRLRSRAAPRRADLVRAVARAFRYPEFLLGGPLELVSEYLAVRARTPRWVRFGRFRGGSSDCRPPRGRL
jgi:hypothetical protein